MRRNRLIIFAVLLFCFTAAVNTYGSETETIIRKKQYSTEDKFEKKDWSYSLNVNRKKYSLKDVKREITDRKELYEVRMETETVKKETDDEYTPDKYIVKNGVRYRLKSVSKNERTVRRDKGRLVTGYLSFDNRSEAYNAPDRYTFTADGATALCSKQNIIKEKTYGWQSSYIDFTFKSTDRDYYEWNDHQIDGNSDNPLKGYDDEILESINALKKNYKIGKTYWKAGAKKVNGVYTRKLRVEVKKKVPHYRVNYKGYSKGKIKKSHVYTMTYKAKVKVFTGKYKYSVSETAIYEYVKKEVKDKPLIYRIGIILLAITVAGVLFIIYIKLGKTTGKESLSKKGQKRTHI